MKTILSFSIILFSALYIGTNLCATSELTCEKESFMENKIDIYEYLKKTQEELEAGVEGLSEEQMLFKPDTQSWSIAEIIEHINIVESSLQAMLQSKIEKGEMANSAQEVKMTDEEVIALITNRTQKVKTQDQFKPSGKYNTSEEALEAFNDQREEITDWLKDSEEDMRKYVNDFPFGKIDGYQTMLFMVGHTERHTGQIEDLKNDPGFPEDQ